MEDHRGRRSPPGQRRVRVVTHVHAATRDALSAAERARILDEAAASRGESP